MPQFLESLLLYWPYVGMAVFMIATTIIARKVDGSLRIDANSLGIMILFMLLGPLSIPMALRQIGESDD